MKLKFFKSGGFAGLNFGCDLDTEKLSRAEADELIQLVKRAALAKSSSRRRSAARDLMNYEILIEDGGKKTRAVFVDMSVPETVQELLDFLNRRSKAMPLDG